MSIGRSIKTLRIQRNMTQGELADKLNVTNKAISSWENDRTEPNMGMIEAMCKVFQCTKTELIDGIISELPKDNHENDDLMDKVNKLSPIQKKEVMRYIDFILSKIDE